MSEEEFAELTLEGKWQHIAFTMGYILNTEKVYQGHPTPKADKDKQRNLRVDQYQRYAHVKSLYAAHRDQMVDTLNNERYTELKNILESVFTMELDDALRDVIDD